MADERTGDEGALARSALRALRSLDLTNLEEGCDEAAIDLLAERAFSEYGHVAALCVWPRFVGQASRLVAGRNVHVATVVNFPTGNETAGAVIEMTEAAVADGADEIDVVIPYRALLEGREEAVVTRVARVKRAAGVRVKVKAILETGVLERRETIRRAADLALEGGADFLKTSTGKVPVNATLRAGRVMLEAIRDWREREGVTVGFKPAGGVRTAADAAAYLDLADEIMGEGWASPETFRIGASGVLDALVAALQGAGAAPAAEGY